MQPSKKLLASFTNADWRRAGDDIEVQDDLDAAKAALKIRAICFNTYEIETVTIDGKELKGDPENISKRRYVGIDKIYTKANSIVEQSGMNFQQDPAGSAYITGLERPGEFIRLEAGEKVFDSKGRLAWPLQPPARQKVLKPGF
jgi:hypothetical protein